MEVAWQGSFIVTEQLSVNYTIRIMRKIKCYHINLLKRYHERISADVTDTHIVALAVADESDTPYLESDYALKSVNTFLRCMHGGKAHRHYARKLKVLIDFQDETN